MRAVAAPRRSHVVLVCPAGRDAGRLTGLHPVGPLGSTVAAWVPDTAAGEPTIPPEGIEPFALVIGGEIDPEAI